MRWLLLGVLMLQVATCGQKGPLTLPEPDVTSGGVTNWSAPAAAWRPQARGNNRPPTGGRMFHESQSDLPVAIVRARDRDREVAPTEIAAAATR
jgi:predicted small lipoprotein YifL